METEYQVQCGNCYASSSIESTEEKAIKSWNRRTPSDHIVDANKKVDNNPPLTMDELRGMDGEPVLIVFDPDADGEMLKMWVLVDADCDDGDVCLENNIGGRTVYCRNEELSGMTLYRRKPEEE